MTGSQLELASMVFVWTISIPFFYYVVWLGRLPACM
jgi:hypothetical protein